MGVFSCCSDEEIQLAGSKLRGGELVAFPTETVYGLGANAYSDSAIKSIFTTKGRPSDNPLIVHVPSLEDARPFVSEIHPIVHKLAAAFWPGPLSIIMPVNEDSGLSKLVTAGLPSVAVRVPNHPVALSLLRAAGVPIAAPSANKSGSPSPTTARHILNDFGETVQVIDGGACFVGLESTVVKVVLSNANVTIRILRPGSVTMKQLEEVTGLKVISSYKSVDPVAAPEAPGMKYRHYAPHADLVCFASQGELNAHAKDAPIAVICFDDIQVPDGMIRISLGKRGDVEEASRRLFDLLRTCDELKVARALIDVDFDKETGSGAALWNRISKASLGKRETVQTSSSI